MAMEKGLEVEKVISGGLFEVRNTNTNVVVEGGFLKKQAAKKRRDEWIRKGFSEEAIQEMLKQTGHLPYKVSRSVAHYKGASNV